MPSNGRPCEPCRPPTCVDTVHICTRNTAPPDPTLPAPRPWTSSPQDMRNQPVVQKPHLWLKTLLPARALGGDAGLTCRQATRTRRTLRVSVWETPAERGPPQAGPALRSVRDGPPPAPRVSKGRGQTGMTTLLYQRKSTTHKVHDNCPRSPARRGGAGPGTLGDPPLRPSWGCQTRGAPTLGRRALLLARAHSYGRQPASHTALPVPTKTRMTQRHPKQTQPTDLHRLNQHKRPFFKNLYSAWLGIKSPVLGSVAGLCQGLISDDQTQG